MQSLSTADGLHFQPASSPGRDGVGTQAQPPDHVVGFPGNQVPSQTLHLCPYNHLISMNSGVPP